MSIVMTWMNGSCANNPAAREKSDTRNVFVSVSRAMHNHPPGQPSTPAMRGILCSTSCEPIDMVNRNGASQD